MSVDYQNNSKLLNELKTRKRDIVESFNEIALNMVNHLGSEFKDSIFGKNNTMIKNFFKFKPNEIIILFLDNIYDNDEFRKEIKASNDSFFMAQTYENAKNAGYESRIFEFKDIWSKMSNSTKMIVKESMGMLIDHCELYIDILSQINKLKNK
jgi:hypothetical protein